MKKENHQLVTGLFLHHRIVSIWIEGLHQDSNDNHVRIVNFAKSKNVVLNIRMFPHRNIYKYTWTSLVGKTHNQIDRILRDRRWHSSILDLRSFRGVNCDTDHCLVVTKVRESLALSNKQHRSLM